VGGSYGPEQRLVVAVGAPAVDGRANAAVVAALADALGIRRSRIRITSGERGRDKTVEIVEGPDDLGERWVRLRDGVAHAQ
jgi:uncharacterized protein